MDVGSAFGFGMKRLPATGLPLAVVTRANCSTLNLAKTDLETW
jgi:hypothetical protein